MDSDLLAAFLARRPGLAAMGREELEDYLDTVRGWIARLDEEEPEDMESEAYQTWGDAHEELEDQADELLERLDELGE